jgi:uncharacterized protein YggE
MLRFVALVLSGLAFIAMACTSETTVVNTDPSSEGISVSGQGSVFGEPDIALLTLGVESTANTVAEARTQAGDAMDAMLAALEEGGVADEDVQTTRFSVQPRYDFTKPQQELIGFIVSNIATVRIRDIDSTGELIDAAVAAGGNNARVESLSFTIDDPSELEAEARSKAMQDAKAKAEALAEAGDVTLGRPKSINEGGGVTPITFDRLAYQEASADASTAIEPGQLEVQVTVSVVYELS